MDEEEVIDVVKIDNLQCDECDYLGRNERALIAHKRHKHNKVAENNEAESPKKISSKPRQRKEQPDPGEFPEQLPRVTTKQLLGGRKRPRTVIEDDEQHRELPELNVSEHDAEMPVGEFVARRANTVYKDRRGQYPNLSLDGAEIIAGEELEVVEEEEVISSSDHVYKNYQNSPRSASSYTRKNAKKYSPSSKIPSRLIEGDVAGKYKCYIEDCHWRCGYRSLRMEHMKAVHPEWKLPPRYILERISKDGIYIDPDEYVPPIACTVEGCEWRGNYRASRSAHMRKVHPFEHAEQKKKLPGYNSSGNYACHYPMCTWRGFSRSTRSTHLKKAHPQWRPEDSRSGIMLTCFHCKVSFPSYPLLLSHIDKQHDGCGMHIDEIFDGRDTFGLWLQRVERDYSITFERTDPLAQPNDAQVYTLHCTCTGPRGMQLAEDCRNYIYQKHNFLKRRQHQLLTRSKCDCSVHLEVREDPLYDRVTVKGSLEHTGHRFGTPLLRLSSTDRHLYSDLIDSKMDIDAPLMALEMVEKLNQFEGFTMENYGPAKTIDFIEPVDNDPFTSLRLIIEERSDSCCCFGVDFSRIEEHQFSFGYMSTEMQKIWMTPKRLVTMDSSAIEFEDVQLYMYTVIVHTDDSKFIPKCALTYFTTDQFSAPEAVLKQLKEVDPNGPCEIICDPSEIWAEIIPSFYPESQVLISEWTLMEFWAAKLEGIIDNELDLFSIVSGLRRMLRSDDVHQMLYFAVELFESCYECGYTEIADFFDTQFSDVEYFKRWSPTHRYEHNSHSLPTLGISSKMLRDVYLSTEHFARIDQWFAHIVQRIEDFNAVDETQTYTMRAIDLTGRKYFYNTIEYHKEMVVYEDEFVMDGELVEEQVMEEEEVVVEEHVVMEEVVEEEEILYDDMIIKDEQESKNEVPMMPHRLHMYQKEEPSTSTSDHHQLVRHHHLPRILNTIRKKTPPLKRDTTKQVVRARNTKKERFAELRDCPREVMRAMAAYAISHDGRKKEQHPFSFVPSHAEMSQSAVPSVVRPPSLGDFKYHYNEEGRGELIQRDKQREVEHQEYLQRFNRQMDEHQRSDTAHLHHYHHEVDDVEPLDEEEEALMVDEIGMEEDEDQPCTSSSLY